MQQEKAQLERLEAITEQLNQNAEELRRNLQEMNSRPSLKAGAQQRWSPSIRSEHDFYQQQHYMRADLAAQHGASPSQGAHPSQ